MFEQERRLYLTRIDNFLSHMQQLFYEDEVGLVAEYRKFDGFVSFENRGDGEFQLAQLDQPWGKDWERAWFHVQGTVPTAWQGKRVVARIVLGGEGLVFSPDGIPKMALSYNSIWSSEEVRRERVELFESAAGGEAVDLWIEASAGQYMGLKIENDHGRAVPKVYGKYEAACKQLSLAVFRKDIWDLYLDCFVLNDLMRALPERSVRARRIMRALNDVIDVFHPTAPTVTECRERLRGELDIPRNPSSLTARAVGHAHLDTAWLWTWHEGIRKCARTFAVQIDNIEKYPDYIFGASQAQHFAFLKEYYPEFYKIVKQKVAEGRIEIQGGMWVEADCNLISGESMVRQILHGKNFWQDEFGVNVRNLWLPDVFGYSAAMPQILRKSGLDYFVTQKISWNQFNTFPHHTFRWRGIDGTEVLTHFPPENSYNSELRPHRLRMAEENLDENALLDEFLCLFGVGDGGHGPTAEHIETGLRQQNLNGSPSVQFGPAQAMLDTLDAHAAELPVWVGELYLELHRGTLTTQAFNKKMNRYLERKLREVECLWSMLPWEAYPAEQLDRMWKRVLLNQFHDIIPGSSITPVYDQCRSDYLELAAAAELLSRQAGEQILQPMVSSLTVVNTLNCEYRRPIELPKNWAGFQVMDASGTSLPVQNENGVSLVDLPLGPLSSLTLRKGAVLPAGTVPAKSLVLENALIRYEFSEAGVITRAFDKELQRDVLATNGKGNIFRLFEDRPAAWDAWDVDVYYENQLLENAVLTGWQRIADGPVRQGLLLDYTIGNSTISQRVFLAKNSKRLDFVTEINWQEDHKLLKVDFDINVVTDFASYEIQYGFVKRPNHRNTSWDMAKFEVVGQRFADLSNNDYGVAILNNCKYGHKILDNLMQLTLLRAPSMPDPKADRGRHAFTYALLPHGGGLIESSVLNEAIQLNQPAVLFDGFAGEMQFPIQIDSSDVVLEVVKKAEREDALILRLYEPLGKSACVTLTLNNSKQDVFETDLMEQEEQKLNSKAGLLTLDFEPFEIKTLKLK